MFMIIPTLLDKLENVLELIITLSTTTTFVLLLCKFLSQIILFLLVR